MRNVAFALCLLFIALYSAHGQAAIYIGAGPSVYTDAPYGAGNLTIGVCTNSVKTCEMTTIEARGSIKTPGTLVYSTSTGIRQVIMTATSQNLSADLFVLGQAGVAVTNTATGLSGTLGGGITLHPGTHPNWSVSFIGRQVYSPVNPGWRPWAGAQIGYTFRTN